MNTTALLLDIHRRLHAVFFTDLHLTSFHLVLSPSPCVSLDALSETGEAFTVQMALDTDNVVPGIMTLVSGSHMAVRAQNRVFHPEDTEERIRFLLWWTQAFPAASLPLINLVAAESSDEMIDVS